MFKPFINTSFNDYRQVRVVVQELPHNPLKQPSVDFQRFCTSLFTHKNFSYEQFKLKYCFINESVSIADAALNEIQLYRRPFAFIFFTVCHTSEELRLVLDEFTNMKQKREKAVYTHLFVRYRTLNSKDEDELSNDIKLVNEVDPDYILTSRPSMSSMMSVDSQLSYQRSLSILKFQDSISIDDSEASDPASLTNSLTDSSTFRGIGTGGPDDDDSEASASIVPNIQPSNNRSKTFRPPLLKRNTMPTTNIFDTFDGDLTRVFNRLESTLSKHLLEPKGIETVISSIDSHIADIRLMIDCEKDCSLLESHSIYRNGFTNDRVFKSILNEFDIRIMQLVIEQYQKASLILGIDATKNKLPKKLIEARTIKRKADCCLLLGSSEKSYQDYRRAFESLKSQNDSIWIAAALEGRVAASYSSVHKPQRQLQKTLSFFKQNSFTKKLPVEKLLNRSNTPLHLQDKFEMAIHIYSTANRSLLNKMEFRLELDACIRWCSLLMEQNDAIKYRDDIDEYVKRINILGSDLEEHIDSIYLNAYLADTFAFLGLERKRALYSRSAAYSGLTLLNEQKGYHDEIKFFGELIKQARIGYGIDDNQLNFPLIQKTILNESLQISFKQNDFRTIIENVHFAIESLIEHMTDPELAELLTYLNKDDQSITCSYCSIPRLKSLALNPLSSRLKVWKVESKLFIYRPPVTVPIRQQSLHRKVDFWWVKNESAQIALVVDNYLPAVMIIDQLEFITNSQLYTKLDTKYRIPSKTTKRLLIDCIPRESGDLRIQGLRYHIWSTDQEFRFGDFPNIRHCICSVDVVEDLPILDLECLLVNDIKTALIDKSTVYKAQVHRGEDLFVTFELINSSAECDINILEIEVYAFGYNMTDSIKISQFDLPIVTGKTVKPKIDLTEIYERCLSRQNRSTSNIENLTIELRLNYSNEFTLTLPDDPVIPDPDDPRNKIYYRRNTIELRLDYLSSVTFEISDIQNDEDDLSYLMCCTIDNHLSEEIIFENSIIKPSESSLTSIKRDKIKLNTFPSDLTQLINDIRTRLPVHIHYKTAISNIHIRLPIDWQYFSNDKIQHHLTDLVQSPYICHWHFERIVNTLHIYLCVISKYYKLSKLEFLFPSSNDIQFLNSNKIIFTDIEPEKYLMAERVLIFSQENNSDVLVVDVTVNNITWKRITLTF